jgi:hypothetical protein
VKIKKGIPPFVEWPFVSVGELFKALLIWAAYYAGSVRTRDYPLRLEEKRMASVTLISDPVPVMLVLTGSQFSSEASRLGLKSRA